MQPSETEQLAVLNSMSLADRLGDLAIAIDSLSPETHPDAIAELLNRTDCLANIAAAIKAGIKAKLHAWIETNKTDLVIGTVRYYVGPKRKVRARSNAAVLEALLDATGGDMEAVCGFLASDPWKHGGIRELLASPAPKDDTQTRLFTVPENKPEAPATPDKFAKLFEVIEDTELKEGKPVRVKSLQKIDTKFLR